MKTEKLIGEALRLPTNAISYVVSHKLAVMYPEKALLETEDWAFDLQNYCSENICTLTDKISIHNQININWDTTEKQILKSVENAWFEVEWQSQQLEVLQIKWDTACGATRHSWILADTKEIADSFFAAVAEWNSQIRDEILVFQDGYWSKDEELFESIQSATFDNIILQGDLKQEIQIDLENFFAMRDAYQEYQVPWKRGILFIGSPGNGKTHAVKALINKMKKPCLYVKSFKSGHGIDAYNIRLVFQRARESAPCILVLEDLDSLINDETRSFFLNELDGFATNEGIVIVATTNHPEQIDSAILDRPSRFDRKYYFDLPALTERVAYIKLWNNKYRPAMRLSEDGVMLVAEMTDGFSFAYLKELFLSSTMQWMRGMEHGSMDKVMVLQIETLKQQMCFDSKN